MPKRTVKVTFEWIVDVNYLNVEQVLEYLQQDGTAEVIDIQPMEKSAELEVKDLVGIPKTSGKTSKRFDGHD